MGVWGVVNKKIVRIENQRKIEVDQIVEVQVRVIQRRRVPSIRRREILIQLPKVVLQADQEKVLALKKFPLLN